MNSFDTLPKQFEYVVLGAGSSGCIIAAQLARAGAHVLLVEAGGSDMISAITNPPQGFSLSASDLVQQFECQVSEHLNGRSVPTGQGRVLGGGGSVNVMIWTRGFASDFDKWEAQGCAGWSFEKVLPFFKKLENWEGGDNAFRASGGPIQVRLPGEITRLSQAWIDAEVGLGLEHVSDINAPMRAGVGLTNLNIDHEGRRCSSARAYLHPALSLPNLTLELHAQVMYLDFEGSRCVGCQLLRRTGPVKVRASREVIVACGGIGSSHLLLRSGVGPAEELKAVGVKVISDIPNVGRNYQDHPMLRGVVLRSRERLAQPRFDSNHAEACSFFHSGEIRETIPDLLGVVIDQPTVTLSTEAIYGEAPAPEAGFTFAVGLMRPSSRGSVRLASVDWRTPPIIDNGLLKTELDLKVAVRGLQHLRELEDQPAFREMIAGEAIPGRRISEKQLSDLARNTTHTFWHPAGTCGMGPADAAVVDHQLRVYGLEGLRICDSSIMPTSPSCPTNAASCMIGLKAVASILNASGSEQS